VWHAPLLAGTKIRHIHHFPLNLRSPDTELPHLEAYIPTQPIRRKKPSTRTVRQNLSAERTPQPERSDKTYPQKEALHQDGPRKPICRKNPSTTTVRQNLSAERSPPPGRSSRQGRGLRIDRRPGQPIPLSQKYQKQPDLVQNTFSSQAEFSAISTNAFPHAVPFSSQSRGLRNLQKMPNLRRSPCPVKLH
jgi:hypothetical protein